MHKVLIPSWTYRVMNYDVKFYRRFVVNRWGKPQNFMHKRLCICLRQDTHKRGGEKLYKHLIRSNNVIVSKWYTVHLLCRGSWKHFTTLLSPVFGHWCDKAAVGCITSFGHSQGESPWCCSMCVHVCVHRKGRMQSLRTLPLLQQAFPPTPAPTPSHPSHPCLHSDVQFDQILWHGDKRLPLFPSFSAFLFLQCHQYAECCCFGSRHRELIQTDTTAFHFSFVISQSVSLQYVHHIVSSSIQEG